MTTDEQIAALAQQMAGLQAQMTMQSQQFTMLMTLISSGALSGRQGSGTPFSQDPPPRPAPPPPPPPTSWIPTFEHGHTKIDAAGNSLPLNGYDYATVETANELTRRLSMLGARSWLYAEGPAGPGSPSARAIDFGDVQINAGKLASQYYRNPDGVYPGVALHACEALIADARAIAKANAALVPNAPPPPGAI